MTEETSKPWWRFGYLWLVLAGPAVVVVASLVTLYLAITRPDPVLTQTEPTATQARNHAATGLTSKPKH
jgi:uncharacterized protein